VARPGVTLRWVLGDLEQAMTRVRSADSAAPLRDRARALGEMLDPRALLGVRGDVFDPSDPMPFAFEVSGKVRPED